MKKISVIIFLAAIISSCNKEDDPVFEKSPDERLAETIAAYQSQLAGSQFGWKGILSTDSGRGTPYSFYFKFNDSNRVKMLLGFDSTTSILLKESSYRLKALQQPSLIFDTYSYIHMLADPDPLVNGGSVGAGLQTDFEFYFDSVSADRITLGGRFNGNKLILTKATQQEENAYNTGQLAAGLSIYKILTYFKRLTIGSQLIDVQIDQNAHTITFNWIDAGGNLQTFTTRYNLTLGGIFLTNPLVIGNLVVRSLDTMTWNPATGTIDLSINGTTATIAGIVVPLRVDVNAPKRWWDFAVNNGNSFWISSDGFHVDGVDDAYGVKSLVSGTNTFYFLIYWPEYTPDNDFFGPVFLDAAQTQLSLFYGTAPRPPVFTADGRAIFSQLGNYGSHPSTGPAARSRTLLYNPTGYYFVQTGETTYDMVSALNGRSWITWEF